MHVVGHVEFDGHRVAYRVAGEGPAVVVLNLYRRREDRMRARLVRNGWQVFHVCPLGYGYSDRVPGYAGEALPDQIVAVLDQHDVDRFVIWGYSAGGAMAACIARATTRAAGLVCGGFSLLDQPSEAQMRQMDRRLRPDHPSRTLWTWVKHIDWATDLRAMSCARLLYWGSQDRQQAKGLARTRRLYRDDPVDFVELQGLDHAAGNAEPALGDSVTPCVVAWASRRLGPAW